MRVRNMDRFCIWYYFQSSLYCINDPTYSTSIQWKPHPTLLLSILPIPLAYSGSHTLLCCSPYYLFHQHIVEATPYSAALHPTYSSSIQWKPHPTLLLPILPIPLAYSGSHTLLCCSPYYLFLQHIVEATPYSAALHPTYSTSIQWKPHPTLLLSILPIPLAYVVEATPYSAALHPTYSTSIYSGSHTLLCCSPSYLFHQHIVEASSYSAAPHPTYSTSIQWKPHPTLLLSILPIPLAYSGSHTLLCCSPSYLFHQHIVETTPYSAALHPTYSTSIQWKPHPTLLLSILPIPLAYSGSHTLLCCSPSYLFYQHIVEASPYSAAIHPTYSTSIQQKPHPTLLLSILPIPLAYIVEATPYSAALHPTYSTSIQWKPHPTLLLSILPIPLAYSRSHTYSAALHPTYSTSIYSGSHTLLCCSTSYLFHQHIQWKPHPTLLLSILPIPLAYIVEATPYSVALHTTYSTSIYSGSHTLLCCSPSYLFHQHIVEATPYSAALHPTYSTSIQWKPHPTLLLSILPIPLAYIVEATPYSAALHPTYSTGIQWKPHPTLLLPILPIPLAYSGSHTLLSCSPSYLFHQHIQWKQHPTLLLYILPIPLAYIVEATPYSAALHPTYSTSIYSGSNTLLCCSTSYLFHQHIQWKQHPTLLLYILPIPLAYSGSHTLLCCSTSYLSHQHIQWKPHPTLLLYILPIPLAYIVEAIPYSVALHTTYPTSIYSGSHILLCCSPSYLFHQHMQWKPHPTLLLYILPILLAYIVEAIPCSVALHTTYPTSIYSGSNTLLCCSPSYLFHQHIVEATPYSAALHPTYSTSIQWKPHPSLLLSILPIPLAYSGSHTLLCCSPSCLFHQHIVEATPYPVAPHPTYSTSIQWKPHPSLLLSILPIPLAYSGSHTLLCCSPSYLSHQHIQWKPHPTLLLSILPIPLAYIVEATPYSPALYPTYSTSIQWKPHPTLLLFILPIPLAYSGSHTLLSCSPSYLFHQHIQWKPHPTLLLYILPIRLAYIVEPHPTLLLSILPIPLAYSGSHTLLSCSPSYLFHQHIVEATPYSPALHPTYSTSIQWKPHPTLLLSILPIPLAYSGSHTLLCCSPSYLFHQHIVEATPYSAALHPTYPTSIYSGSHTLLCCSPSYLFHWHIVEATPYSVAPHPTYSTSIQWKPHPSLLLSILPIPLAYIVEATPYSAALHPTYPTSIYSGSHTLLCCSPSYLFHQHIQWKQHPTLLLYILPIPLAYIVEATPYSAALHPTYSTSIQWKPHPTLLLYILPIPLAYIVEATPYSAALHPTYSTSIYSGSHTLLCCSPYYLSHQHIQWKPHLTLLLSILPIPLAYVVEATPYSAALHPTYSTSIYSGSHTLLCCSPYYLSHQHIQWKPHPTVLLSILPIPLAYSGSHTLLCCSSSYLFHQHIVEATPFSAALHTTYSTSIQWKPHPTLLLSILPIPLAYSGSHTLLCCSPSYLFHQHIVEATPFSPALHPTYSTSIQWKPHPTLLLSILPIPLAYIVEATPYSAALHPTYSTSIYSGSHTLLSCSLSYLFHQHIVEATPYSAALHPTYSTSIQWKPHPSLLLSILPIPLAYIVEATPYSAALHPTYSTSIYSGTTPYSAALHPTYPTSIQWKPHPTLLLSILPIPLAYSGSHTLLSCSPSYLFHQHIVEATPYFAALHPTYSTSIQWKPHPTLLLYILPIPLAYIVEATPYFAALHPTYSTSIQWKSHPTLLLSILPIPLAYSGSHTLLCCSSSYLFHQHIQWKPHPTLLLSILPIPLAYSGGHTLLCCSSSTYSTSIQWKPHPTLLLFILPIPLAYIVEATPYSAALHPTYPTSIQWKPHLTLLLFIHLFHQHIVEATPYSTTLHPTYSTSIYSGSHTLLSCSPSYRFAEKIPKITNIKSH